tara:strand:- start:192 stop:422 length:231 start_codon:yes stop_codon:yes gene_type:complete
MMNEMNDIYPDGPITNGDKKLMELKAKLAEVAVYDCTEDLYWTLKDSCDDEGGDKLDDLIQEFRDKAVKILTDHSA